MKKTLLSLIAAAAALAVVGCNAGETPVEEVQTVKTSTPQGAPGGGQTNIPAGAQGSIPSNAIPPPPKGGG